MVESLLSGLVLSLLPIIIIGLITIAYLQFRCEDKLNI